MLLGGLFVVDSKNHRKRARQEGRDHTRCTSGGSATNVHLNYISFVALFSLSLDPFFYRGSKGFEFRLLWATQGPLLVSIPQSLPSLCQQNKYSKQRDHPLFYNQRKRQQRDQSCWLQECEARLTLSLYYSSTILIWKISRKKGNGPLVLGLFHPQKGQPLFSSSL